MYSNGQTCFPHFPGRIAQVEGKRLALRFWNDDVGELRPYVEFKAEIYGQERTFPTYERAAAWCVRMKELRAEAEIDANIGEAGLRPSYLPRDRAQLDAGVPSIADELAS